LRRGASHGRLPAMPLRPLLLAAALLGAGSRGGPDYVPDSGWQNEAWAKDFYESWFGRQLRAMHEPPLATAADLKRFRMRIRLTVLPTSAPATAYRVDERPDGAMILRWTRLDGRGGYAPGVIDEAGVRRLTAAEARALRAAIAQAGLASLPRELQEVDEAGHPSICIDGTFTVIEKLDAQGRIYLTRNCGIDEEPLRRLALSLIALSGRVNPDSRPPVN
jgi:hypothetical protein